MSKIVLKIENVAKQYRLGLVGTGTFSHDLKRWWYSLRGLEDPFKKLGIINDRNAINSDYVWALKDINIDVNKGEVIGLIGRNGAGKSTLLKLLSQVTSPTEGSIKIEGRIASLLEIGTGFHPELTGKENVFLNGAILGMTKDEIYAKLDEIIKFSGIGNYINTPVKRYSSGMMVRLGFAVAAHLEPEILVVDEVLAVGDADFQKKCIGKMKDVAGQGRTVIFVSHNMASIAKLCERSILIDNGRIIKDGKTSDVIDYYIRGNISHNNFGIVPKSFPRNSYHKDILSIKEITPFNYSGEHSKNFFKNEIISFTIIISSTKLVKDPVLILFLMNDEIGHLTYSSSFNGNENEIKSIFKGENEINIEISQKLLPGSYSIGFSILNKLGYPYEAIQFYGEIKIEKFDKKGNNYPWNKNFGIVESHSKFSSKIKL